MDFTFGIGILLAVLYGMATCISGILQLKAREIALWAAIGMSIAGFIICISSIFILMDMNLLILLIACFLFVQIIAILNGFNLYGKINPNHHMIRFSITLLILFLLLHK